MGVGFAGTSTQTAVKARLKQVVNDPEWREECDAPEVCLDLTKTIAAAKKAAQTKLDAKVLGRYAKLSAAEIAGFLVDDKWVSSAEGATGQEAERLTVGLADRVWALEERQANAVPVN